MRKKEEGQNGIHTAKASENAYNSYQKVVEELLRQINALKASGDALKVAASTVHQKMADRVFGQGKDASGGAINGGEYSTKPMYVSTSKMAKEVQAKGKTGKSKKKNGEPYKSKYFEGGYKQFRKETGRARQPEGITDFVNLRYTGQMERDFDIAADGKKYVSGFGNSTNAKKADGNEIRNGGPIFAPTKQEISLFGDVFNFEINKRL